MGQPRRGGACSTSPCQQLQSLVAGPSCHAFLRARTCHAYFSLASGPSPSAPAMLASWSPNAPGTRRLPQASPLPAQVRVPVALTSGPAPSSPPQMLKGGRPSVHFYLRPRLRPTQAPPRARAARAARAPRSSSTCRPRPPSQWAPPPRASRPAPPLVPQPPVAWPQSCAGGGRLSYLSVTAAEACRSCSWGLPSHHVAERGGEPAG